MEKIIKGNVWTLRFVAGEILVGPPKALFMDEISTGLDSSTTHRIVKCLAQFCHILEDTVMISLLQPDPGTFELFDDVVLLSEGHIVYHGPRQHVLAFFESCGFQCPDRKGVADFLQEVRLSRPWKFNVPSIPNRGYSS